MAKFFHTHNNFKIDFLFEMQHDILGNNILLLTQDVSYLRSFYVQIYKQDSECL